MKIENEWVKRFLLGASLILFAGIVFYIVAPKWHYLYGDGGFTVRYNSITGEAWVVDEYEYKANIMKVRFKNVKSL